MANFLCWNFGGRKKIFFAASSVKKISRFEEVSPEEIKRIAWKFTKTVILLGLAGYELIITNSAYGLVGYIYISSYPARPRRITVNYYEELEAYIMIMSSSFKRWWYDLWNQAAPEIFTNQHILTKVTWRRQERRREWEKKRHSTMASKAGRQWMKT